MCPRSWIPRFAQNDRHWIFLAAVALVFTPAPAAEMSEPAPLAAKSLLLGVARAGDRLVAVGDRGHVLLSDDNGSTWRQVAAPTRAMLTSVSFPDAKHGWAVGHDGVILASTDGGETWQRQDDGKDLESVFLHVFFADAARGFAVGAYGKFLATADGGRSWVPARPAPEEVHYNDLAAGPNGWLYLAGESGTLLVSRDGGREWIRAEVPYDGSLFGTLPLGNQSLVVFGLRGHILTSADNGASWQPHPNDRPALIMAGTRLANGTIVLAGQGGNIFLSRDAGATFVAWKPADFGSSIASLVEAADGVVVTVGEAGAVRVPLP
jgi:photosystem II stability/assembly factor-like uncharacterized protein